MSKFRTVASYSSLCLSLPRTCSLSLPSRYLLKILLVVVAISPLLRSCGNMRVRLTHEDFHFSLKIIYQRKLVLIFFVERKLGFPFGFGEIRNENTKGKVGSSKDGKGEREL